MSAQASHAVARVQGSFLLPTFEHGRVADAMRPGVISCSADTPMAEVARIMATNHIHALVVTDVTPEGEWGIVTDQDVVATAHEAADRAAGSCAHIDPVTVDPGKTLEEAAVLMRDKAVSHLVVVHPARTMPIGVLSTLDIVGVVAWGRA
jgi:CBS domain-containing protein